MSRVIRLLVGCGFLLGLAPAPCSADTVSVSVSCSTGSQTVNFEATLSCMDQLGGAEASVSVGTPGNVSVLAQGVHGDSAQASYTAAYQLLVTNGLGSGLFEPCFVVQSAISGGSASASFGRVAAFGNEVLCGGPPMLAVDTTPFVFGVPQTDQLTMMAFGGGFSGGGFASWSGSFEVFDSSGNPLPSAVVSLIDISVPEPNFLAPFTMLLALVCLLRHQRRPKS